MTENWQDRTELLLGKEKLKKLASSHVLVAGLGGVGASVAEMLCRAGIGELTLADHDKVQDSNRNRQMTALTSTTGKLKAEVLKDRLLDINPLVKINLFTSYLKDESIVELLAKDYDYVVDAIDTLSPKGYFIQQAVKNGLKLISSLGAAGITDPSAIRISDISESHNCKLGYYLRKKLHKLGIQTGFRVVFSTETVPRSVIRLEPGGLNKKSVTGTISYMPVIFGCYCAYAVISEIC